MKYKENQRVAYYKVTGLSDPAPSANVSVGDVLVDRPRGEETSWDFINTETGAETWIAATRIGFARVNAELKPIPEPSLQVILDMLKEASDV